MDRLNKYVLLGLIPTILILFGVSSGIAIAGKTELYAFFGAAIAVGFYLYHILILSFLNK